MSIKEKLIAFSDKNKLAASVKVLYWRIENIPNQLKVEMGIRKRSRGNRDARFLKIKRFQHRHPGKRCFIIATGPSLTIADIESLRGEITFGMNSISRIFDQTTWRPTYYGIQDRQVYEKMEESILSSFLEEDNVFVADRLGLYFELPDRFVQFPYNGNYHLYCGKYGEYSAKFSDDAYAAVYDGYSITYSLIQLAVYMGFREIYLLGCDCNYPKGEKNHFVESGFIDKNAASNPVRMRVGYAKAKEYADAHGIKIVNCTRGGMLEVFPRMALEEVLQEARK